MRRNGSGFGPLQIAITILVAATALVHLFLGVNIVGALMSSPAQAAAAGFGGIMLAAILGVLFLCNFCGYVVLNVALYLPLLRRFQPVTRALLIGFTAVTIVAYFAIDRTHALNLMGLADKTVEAALIVLLVIEGRRPRA
jgi:hypothetical protein